ncbi:PREDICTED: protein RALF-like 20 [Camelina sativa]|uniref:Protein RALF-like 20 n=1 Tax=Camelina sativa TaxID=90675 RepID=A0ABM0WNY2_CAMSA|nr:PREDICTED: protein RALF-like 20 [Camelina sativa]
MVISKKTVIQSFALMIIIAIVTSTTEAKTIGNPAMRTDEPKGCPPGSPPSCKMQPANPYTRGCEPSHRCRGD